VTRVKIASAGAYKLRSAYREAIIDLGKRSDTRVTGAWRDAGAGAWRDVRV
jgi:hypothetical protein